MFYCTLCGIPIGGKGQKAAYPSPYQEYWVCRRHLTQENKQVDKMLVDNLVAELEKRGSITKTTTKENDGIPNLDNLPTT